MAKITKWKGYTPKRKIVFKKTGDGSLKNYGLLRGFETDLQAIFGNFEKELEFHPTRKFRFDYAIPKLKIAFEINGGQYIDGGGRHNREGQSYENDLTKTNLAGTLGWRVFSFTYQMLQREEHRKIFNILKEID